MIMATVAGVGLLMVLVLWWSRGPLIIVEPAPQPQSASVDHEIFDIVLTDLLDNKEFDPGTWGRGVKKSQIVLGETTYGSISHSFLKAVFSQHAQGDFSGHAE
jgi:hypothetical protein